MRSRPDHAPGDTAEAAEISAADDFPVSWRIFALARSHRALAARLLSGLGLHPGQELILMQLWDAEGRSQKELREMQGLDHSTVAQSVRRLEAAGLVRREQSAQDRRVTLVFLTEEGRRLEAPVRTAWAELEQQTVAGLTSAGQGQFLDIARTITRNVEPG
jgi:MarR family transcriptional regulator, organic hydroperoxide resistance regulator